MTMMSTGGLDAADLRRFHAIDKAVDLHRHDDEKDPERIAKTAQTFLSFLTGESAGTYDDSTLFKVRDALTSPEVGLEPGLAGEAITAMQNAGILFRERS